MTIGYVVTWDSQPSSAAVPTMINQRVSRGSFGAVRDHAVDVPGRDGAYVYQERRGNRTISVQGQLVSDSPQTRHADAVVMADWLDRSGYRQLVFSDQTDRYWRAYLSSDIDPDEWKAQAKYSITWSAEPYAYDFNLSTDCQNTVLTGVEQDFTIPDAIDALPVVEITARGGDAVTVDLTTNGDLLQYAGTIVQNETITISSLNNTLTAGVNTDLELTGTFVSGMVFPDDVSGVFPVLVEGLNTYTATFAGTATSLDVCYTWRRRYR